MDPHIWPSKSRTTSANIHTSAMWRRDVTLKTFLRRWTIERSGERGSGISVQAARHNDDDDDDDDDVLYGGYDTSAPSCAVARVLEFREVYIKPLIGIILRSNLYEIMGCFFVLKDCEFPLLYIAGGLPFNLTSSESNPTVVREPEIKPTNHLTNQPTNQPGKEI